MSVEAEKVEELSGEDLIQQALGAEPEVEQQEEQEQEAPREYSAIEKEAMDMGGWKPKEDFIADGGDADRWSSAHEFVKYGKLQASVREQKQSFDRKAKEFDERLENVNKIHQATLETKIAEVRTQMRTAASEADIEGFDSAQKQLEHLEGQRQAPVATTPGKDPSIQAWEDKNSWINDPEDPRALTAQGAWNNFYATNPHATADQALNHVDKMVAKISPPTNPLRDAAATTETTARPAARVKSRALTMSDLNQDERDMWRHTGASMWGGDEAKYLKACTDARKGA
jgi:hypothetical protein